MISPQPHTDLHNAKEYFRVHLAVGDFCAIKTSLYYAEKNSVVGEWFGEGAARLKLTGVVSEAAFVALCDGSDPKTGERLTLRRNSVRRENGKWVANRRIFSTTCSARQKAFRSWVSFTIRGSSPHMAER